MVAEQVKVLAVIFLAGEEEVLLLQGLLVFRLVMAARAHQILFLEPPFFTQGEAAVAVTQGFLEPAV
jgi:hypothetical protein